MPKAEVGSTKWLGNKMKARGLQRLRWYCQVCERQMRDANGFKQHTLSEAHVRQMQAIGANANRAINDFSEQFKSDFLQLLRTSHGEKKINLNHFYQELIANKTHVHLNATKWPTLTEFAKYLGREGICRIEEGERGLEISWVDNSPEALRRQATVRKKERQDKGDEEREQKLISEQVERAKRDAGVREQSEKENTQDVCGEISQEQREKISMKIDLAKPMSLQRALSLNGRNTGDLIADEVTHLEGRQIDEDKLNRVDVPSNINDNPTTLSLRSAISVKPKNVFALAAKRNTLADGRSLVKAAQKRPITEAERIMREELKMIQARDRSEPQAINKRQKT